MTTTGPNPATSVAATTQLRRALASLKDLRGRLEEVERARHEPIAVVGMACRYPGATDPESFWALLRDGVDAVTETPAERWDAAALFDPDPEAAGRVTTRWGGFLDGIDQFDAPFFGIAPREAAQMDPQQRLLLEVAWEALEDGGQPPPSLAGTNAGVFVGVHSHADDYFLAQATDPRRLDLYSGTGTSHSVLSGRLSYLLDLRGPSLAVDTACSSSLVAVHLAVQSLRTGECSLALVGGVNTMTDPTFTIVASRMRMMSARGRCQPFDARADGFVRAEGCGVVVLKRLSDAVAAGDRVLAVIRGSAVNQDGHSNGLTAPNSLSQQAVIGDALRDAGAEPAEIGLIEAHGTGTPLGDPIEVEALGAVFGGRPGGGSCALGSVKANIGHAEGAAGVAGLIKAVLAVHHGEVPGLVHFETLNPHISLAGTPFVLPTETGPWPAGAGPRTAGVSSFGWSGTNAHVIVGQAPALATAAAAGAGRPCLLAVSARSVDARRQLVTAYRDLLATGDGELADVCAAAATRRAHHGHRLAAAGRTAADVVAALDAHLAGDDAPGLAVTGDDRPAPDVVFVFPGQGAQWAGMGRRLLADEPAFRAALEDCERAMAAHVDWSVIDVLDAGDPRLEQIDVIQPTLFAVQVGLAALWREWGVEPDAVVGHSMGEVAAAHVAGILSLDDAATVICRRSALLRRISGRGAMAVVDLPVAEAERAIGALADRVAVAVSNSPTSTVLSGDPDAIDDVLVRLEAADVFGRKVNVDVASHSPQVDDLRGDLLDALDGIRPQPAAVAFFSTVTGRLTDGRDLGPDYWVRNLRQPVQFGATVGSLLADGYGRFVELSPHPLLLTAVAETAAAAGRPVTTVASLRRDADEPLAMLGALGALYADGYSVDWDRRHPVPGRPVDLPSYPWQHERYWIDAPAAGTGRRGHRGDGLLGWPVPLAGADRAVWENELEQRDHPRLYEHRIGGQPSVPAAGLLDALQRAAGAGRRLTGVRFERVLLLDDDRPTTIQVERAGAALSVHRAVADGWTRHATATAAPSRPRPPATAAVDAVRSAAAPRKGDELYGALAAAGADLGPSLRPLARVWSDGDRHAADVHLDGDAFSAFDACLQLAAVAGGDDETLLVPVAAAAAELHATPAGPATCVATFAPAEAGAPVRQADVVLLDGAGAVAATIEGLVVRRLDTALDRPDDWVYGVEWQVTEARPARPAPAGPWVVVGGEAGPGAALVAALTASGHRAVPAGVDLAAALAGAGAVVFLAAPDGGDAASGVLDLLAALREHGRPVPVWIVTRGVAPVGGGVDRAAVAQAPLWGIGRAMAEERPDLWAGLIDLDPAAGVGDVAAALAAELAAADGTDGDVALRGDHRYVARLARRAAPAAPVTFRPDAAYLVTGGFGAIGTEVARWLVAGGARRVILLGRTELPPRAEWARLDPASPGGRRAAAVRQLEAAGAAVHVAAVDAGDPAALAAYLDGYRAEGWPAIRGVFHTAATFGGQLLDDLTASELDEQLRAKALGAWTLAEQLPDLDHFVLFSSIASQLAMAGQAAYAAGNAYLDALAAWRAAQGRPALSVDWGFWEGSAEAGDRKDAARTLAEARGLRGLRPEQGLDVLGRLLGAGDHHAVVVPVDWAAFAAAHAARPVPLVAGLVAEQQAATATTGPLAGPSLADQLAAAAEAERTDVAEAAVRRLLGRVLKLPEARIDRTQPFGTLGLDSLMAIELRNRLEADLGRRLPATLAWNHPTVRDLGAYVAGLCTAASPPAAPAHEAAPAGAATAAAEQLAAAVAELSDDDALLALLGRGEP